MGKGIFITGTDTGAGKTWFTVMLMSALKCAGYSVAGMKPVASGATQIKGHLVNDDAALIQKHCSNDIDYETVNPVVFAPPAAPHIVAEDSSQQIDFERILNAYNKLIKANDIVIVEGVGGWRVPLSKNSSTVDLVKELNIPVILVVGIKLGCINHAILTAEALKSDGVKLCAWASSQLEKDYLFLDQTYQELEEKIHAPKIAETPYSKAFAPDALINKLDFKLISNCLPEKEIA